MHVLFISLQPLEGFLVLPGLWRYLMPVPLSEGQLGRLLLRLISAEKSPEPLDPTSCLAPCCRVGPRGWSGCSGPPHPML